MVGKEKIRINPQKCTGCRICELVCSFTKYDEFNPKRSRIRIVKMEKLFVDIPVVCRQCHNPMCEVNCPVGAIKRDTNGRIQVDARICTGCELCIEACPFGAISIDPLNNTAIICDLCDGSPQCVKWCPTGALEFRRADSKSQRKRWDAVVGTTKSLLKGWGIPWEEYEQHYGRSSQT